MRRSIHSTRRRGESLVETVSSVFVVSIGVCGMAAASVVSVRSEKMSSDLDRAAGTASGAVEDMRSAVKRGEWSRLQTDFDQKQMTIDGCSSKTTDSMLVRVSETATDLSDSTGMWETGATSPNFVFVRIGASSTTNGGTGGGQMQTYIANRNGLSSGGTSSTGGTTTGGGGGTTSGGTTSGGTTSGGTTSGGTTSGGTTSGGTTVTSAASQLGSSIANFFTSGASKRLTKFDLQHAGTSSVRVQSATLTLPDATKVTKFTIGRTVAFNSARNSTSSVTTSWTGTKGPEIKPGTLAVSFLHSGDAMTSSKPATMTLTFTDGTTSTWTVRP